MKNHKLKSKKILFIRHGESFDDIFNEYGSWTNRELSPQGVLTAFEVFERMKHFHSFEIIVTSPLKRASQTATILGEQLGLRVEEDHYLIERNTYGLLAGINRDLAVEKYPELNAAYLEGNYIHGAERYPDFKTRISALIQRLLKNNYSNIICVTHGFVITEIVDNYTDKTMNSIGNGSMIELDFSNYNKTKKADIANFEKITFTDDEEVKKGLARRKFNRESRQ